MTAYLPAPLMPWASELSVLDPKFAASLGPLLRVLEDLTARHDRDPADSGILDGYSGITVRGMPERILASEWALADEFPMEFLRRASGGELLYTAPAYQAERKRGRVAVLVDAGPDQLGAGRLVQLAALIVLHRRAAARGGDLMVGVLGDSPGNWSEGDVRRVLRNWLAARRRHDPEPAEVDAWQEELAAPGEMWLLTGPRLARRLPARTNMLVSAEAKWDVEGATAVRVTLDEISRELPLPDRHLSVKALRGAAFREEQVAGSPAAGMRFPMFASADPRLLARGDGPDELLSIYVPSKPNQSAKLRRHRFPGPVLAASYLGGRLVGLIAAGGELRAHVIGKRLGRVDRLAKPLNALPIDIDQALAEFVPVYFKNGNVVSRLGGDWWTLTPDGEPPHPLDLVTVAATGKVDEPRLVVRYDNAFQRSWSSTVRAVTGGTVLTAWSEDEITWTVGNSEITVDEGARVVGVLRLHDVPTLITVSRAGLIVRAVSADRTHTLSKWSGAGTPILHPTKPWIGVQRSPSAIDVGDLESGEVLLQVRSGR